MWALLADQQHHMCSMPVHNPPHPDGGGAGVCADAAAGAHAADWMRHCALPPGLPPSPPPPLPAPHPLAHGWACPAGWLANITAACAHFGGRASVAPCPWRHPPSEWGAWHARAGGRPFRGPPTPGGQGVLGALHRQAHMTTRRDATFRWLTCARRACGGQSHKRDALGDGTLSPVCPGARRQTKSAPRPRGRHEGGRDHNIRCSRLYTLYSGAGTRVLCPGLSAAAGATGSSPPRPAALRHIYQPE